MLLMFCAFFFLTRAMANDQNSLGDEGSFRRPAREAKKIETTLN